MERTIEKKHVMYLDLKTQYLNLQEEMDAEIKKVITDTAFAGGAYVENFEKRFSTYCQVKFALGVANGTEALWLAIKSLRIKEGDEIITAPNSFIATAEAISIAGAKPVFVDVLDSTYNINYFKIEEKITNRTKAIIPVHLYGQMADMREIIKIAEKYKLNVIEDASQAHGAEYMGKKAGSLGSLGCFSFYPGKNLGAYGEGGCVITNNETHANYVKLMRDHGQPQKYYHDIIGWNSRMDGIQGAVLNVKLRYLETWNDRRREIAQIYQACLHGIGDLILPVEAQYGKHVYHIYAIRTKHRDELNEHLKRYNIHCAIHYPIPIHLQKAYQDLGIKAGSYPVSEALAREELSLPIYPELVDDNLYYVAEKIIEYFNGRA